MAGKKRSALLEQLADLDDPTPKDFDPEDDRPLASDEEGSEGSDSDAEAAARDHYVSVGKSKLRKPEQPSLGPQYAGSRVSRDAARFEDEEEDDPFAKGFEEESSDEDVEDIVDGELDSEEVLGADGAEGDSEDEILGEGSDEEEDDEGSDIGDESEDVMEGDEDQSMAKPAKASSADAAEARRIMAQEQKSVATSISQAAKDDADKGRAVKKHRTTFDNLLNTRIKLQKSLIGSNTLSGMARDSKIDSEEGLDSAFKAAEAAAFSLWSSLASLRDSLESARSGKKRRHADFASDAPTSELWAYTQSQDTAAQPFRDSVLEKWYSKTHVTEAVAQSRTKLNQTNTSSSVHDILQNHLADSSRLIKRARTPRSCAPYQLQQATAKKPRSNQPNGTVDDDSTQQRDLGDPTVYDDADFYSVLLTTLLEQKSTFTPGATAQSKALPDDLRNLNGYQIRREAKTKKVVDTKASKGRKLRYTVHEKLMNFCAPEDRGTWGERQVDELFSSLLGRRVELESESEDEGRADDGWAAVDEGEKTLLFGR
ncbi:BFR2-like protein [Elsinoe australis]|uniref:Protein BFR2 n=1 Tax=Elsinoe australis TaxID=40998 RepID=A0A4U7B5G7_9PEZI|nr:BFR2-like protein [Elsinoe australis]